MLNCLNLIPTSLYYGRIRSNVVICDNLVTPKGRTLGQFSLNSKVPDVSHLYVDHPILNSIALYYILMVSSCNISR